MHMINLIMLREITPYKSVHPAGDDAAAGLLPLELYQPSYLVIEFLPFILHVPPHLVAVAALVEKHID